VDDAGREGVMRWQDFATPDGSGTWQGLDLLVDRADLRAGAPVFRVCAGERRLRVECAGAPVLWAHVHRWRYGLWVLLAPHAASWAVVPPITRPDLAAVDAAPHTEAWWRAWSRWFARELVASPRTPLSAGRWALTPAHASGVPSPPTPKAQFGWSYGGWELRAVHDVRTCLDEAALRWESWFINGSGGLLRSHLAAPADAARPRAFRKRVRDGTLPPVLVTFVSGLDMFVLLDGHDRLRAALAEGTVPPILVLWKVRADPNPRMPDREEEVLRGIEREREARGGRESLLATEAANRRLITVFDDRDTLHARTAAWPLVGGAARWEREVAAEGVAEEHLLWSGEPPGKPQ
jgi:hypothetical protein